MKRFTAGLLAAIVGAFLIGPAGAQKKSDAETMLEAARQKETLQGDLKEAIKEYGAVAAKYAKTDRAAAAMALVHMAECYQKMGDAESRKIYEQVVKDYADQKPAVTLARARLGNGPPAQNAGVVSWQVWTRQADSVSGDGRTISFTNHGDLMLHDLTTREDRRLVATTAGEGAGGSVISPDGKQVAYLWHKPGGTWQSSWELRLIELNGSGKPRVLLASEAGSSTPYTWSPDGKWIAVQVHRTDGTYQQGLIAVADGTQRVLKTNSKWTSRMVFSPDGRYVAYDLAPNGDSSQHDVYVIATDGSRETPVVVHPADDRVIGWASDGRLLFTSNRSGTIDLWAVPLTDGKLQGKAEFVKAGIDPSRVLGLTPAGALYYIPNSGTDDAYMTSVDFESGKRLAPLTRIAQQQAFGHTGQPMWSPDGKYVAFGVWPPNGPPHVGVLSTVTGRVRELTPNLPAVYGPGCWSPDSSFLAATGLDGNGRNQVFRLDPQTGEATQLTSQGGNGPCPFSADGRTLYFQRNDTLVARHILYALDMQSGQEREVMEQVYGAELSPDGRFLAVQRFAGDNSSSRVSVALVPVDGGAPRELLRVGDGDELGLYAWSPDGQHMAVERDNRDKSESLLLVPTNGGAPRELLHLPAHENFDVLNWSQDGRFVIFTKDTSDVPGGLWSIAVAGGAPRKLEVGFEDFGDHVDVAPGGRIAFTAHEHTQGGLWVLEDFLHTANTNR